MEDIRNFLFDEPVNKVEQLDRTPKKIFILGVYASAVHAKWISPKGKTLIKALAVASEPYIFWRGDDVEDIISKIKLPGGAGKLISAGEKFNGPSGNALDSEYLIPLGLNDRRQCWLCDLVPYSMMNLSQLTAIMKNIDFLNELNIPFPTLKDASLENRKISADRRNEILEEIKLSQTEYLITLGNEPITNFISKFCPEINELDRGQNYGCPREINLTGIKIKLIRLVHPRQAARLGLHDNVWFEIHQAWKTEAQSRIGWVP